MTMQDFINFAIQEGMAVLIIVYFLFKDYKFNGQIVEVLQEIKNVLCVMKGSLDDE